MRHLKYPKEHSLTHLLIKSLNLHFFNKFITPSHCIPRFDILSQITSFQHVVCQYLKLIINLYLNFSLTRWLSVWFKLEWNSLHSAMTWHLIYRHSDSRGCAIFRHHYRTRRDRIHALVRIYFFFGWLFGGQLLIKLEEKKIDCGADEF